MSILLCNSLVVLYQYNSIVKGYKPEISFLSLDNAPAYSTAPILIVDVGKLRAHRDVRREPPLTVNAPPPGHSSLNSRIRLDKKARHFRTLLHNHVIEKNGESFFSRGGAGGGVLSNITIFDWSIRLSEMTAPVTRATLRTTGAVPAVSRR